MKKIFVFSILCLVIIAGADNAFAQSKFVAPPDSISYGVYTNGVFFIAKKLVDAVEGSRPQLMAKDLTFVKKDMVLSTDKRFYYFESGKTFSSEFEKFYCFAIGDSYIPDALTNINDPKILEMFKKEHVRDNFRGGFNFATSPLPVPGR